MSEDHMLLEESPALRSLLALIGGSFSATLSKLSSTSLSIPTNSDFHSLYNSDEFKRPIDELAGTSQCLLGTIGGSANVCGKPMKFSGDIAGDDAYDWLVNVNDGTFRRIDDSVDEFWKIRKEMDSKNAIAVSKIDDKQISKHEKAKVSFHIPTIKKPQEEYNILVNNANKPFEHVWLEKSEDSLHYIHPLEKLSVMDFVDKNMTEMKPVKPLPLEGTPFKLVEEVKDLEDLAAKLCNVEEFAVDLEHNQYRSFQGLTCLMQISTRYEDYIVDTFKLWDHIGPYLREIFQDPKKRKVMHGADRDIIWLQRDFGIYICNLFDTGQASRVLKLERKSLEFLLKHYCGVAANKEYQNADWRIRPLPDVMIRYAREDTHYLLYIYDVMQIDLHKMTKDDEQSDSSLIEVYNRSYDVCMQLYEKELLTGDSYLHMYGVQAANYNAVQLSIVAGLCEWRDLIARADDESTGYVLPNKTLFEIAKEMPINVGKLRRLLKAKLPYIERNIDAVVSVIRRSMQNAAAFEPVVQSLEESRLKPVVRKNIKTTNEETDKEAVASSNLKNISGVSTSVKVSVNVSKKERRGFGTLLSKRKFESDNKESEEVKVSKFKPDEIITLDDDDDDDDESDEETLGKTDYIASEMASKGSLSVSEKLKTCDSEVIVLDDDDSDNSSERSEDEEMRRKSETQGRFFSLKSGFFNK